MIILQEALFYRGLIKLSVAAGITGLVQEYFHHEFA